MDLNVLGNWSQSSQLVFNASKCQLLHLGNRNIKHSYSIQQEPIPAFTLVRDLGVEMDSKLKFQQHFEGKISKANRLTGVLRRTFSHLDGPTLFWLYKALVRPHLEYCNAITSPRTITLMKAVKAVQRRATKQVAELRNIPYKEHLQQL